MSLDDATRRELARLAPCRRGRGKLMAMRLLLLAALLLLVAVGWWYGREVDELVDESGEHL